jgi:hypothetical protein
MKSRTVSAATPDWPSALMNCCAAHVGLAGEGVDAVLDLFGRGQHAEAARGLHLKPFVDQRLAGLGHHIAGRVQKRQEAAALLDLVIRDDVVIDARGNGKGALCLGLGHARQDGSRHQCRGQRQGACAARRSEGRMVGRVMASLSGAVVSGARASLAATRRG